MKCNPPAPFQGKRSITSGERKLLYDVFQASLPYGILQVDANTENRGGEDNSITPLGIPYFSTRVWCADFSDKTVCESNQGLFIHEFVHVWQQYHFITKLDAAVWLYVRHLGDYEKSYSYDLSDEDDLTDFNIEQQASIIEDWWRISRNPPLAALKNTGKDSAVTTYGRFVDQLRSTPWTPLRSPRPKVPHSGVDPTVVSPAATCPNSLKAAEFFPASGRRDF